MDAQASSPLADQSALLESVKDALDRVLVLRHSVQEAATAEAKIYWLLSNTMNQCSAKTKAGNRCQNSTMGKRCSAHSRSTVQLLDAMYKKYGLDQVTEKDWNGATEYIHQMAHKASLTQSEKKLLAQAKQIRAKFQDKVMADILKRSDRTRSIPRSGTSNVTEKQWKDAGKCLFGMLDRMLAGRPIKLQEIARARLTREVSGQDNGRHGNVRTDPSNTCELVARLADCA
jgi:hypothetical protein